MVQADRNSTDVERLTTWMSQYGTDVLNVAYSYIRHYQQAQDITQDVFLRAYNNMHTFRNDSSVRTWLLSITVNRCKDYLRSWHHRKVAVEEDVDLSGSAETPEHLVVNELENQTLWQAVAELPLKYSEVLILFYLRDLTGHEVAQILNTSEQNVRTRLHRARTLLRRKLEEKGWDDDEKR